MREYQTIFINGEVFNCYQDMSLKDILIYLDVKINNVVIEYNKQIITSEKFSTIFFEVSDSIEIITIVGGG